MYAPEFKLSSEDTAWLPEAVCGGSQTAPCFCPLPARWPSAQSTLRLKSWGRAQLLSTSRTSRMILSPSLAGLLPVV